MNELDDRQVDRFRRARDDVLRQIAGAAARAGRSPDDVTLVAVSKTVPADRLRAAVAAGLTTLGENRVQEGELKAAEVPGATWHLVGPLQSNKARRALETFAVIQSVDSLDIARRLDTLAGSTGAGRSPVLLQVNVDLDPGKAGFEPDALAGAAEALGSLEHLELRGLMTSAGSPRARRPRARRSLPCASFRCGCARNGPGSAPSSRWA